MNVRKSPRGGSIKSRFGNALRIVTPGVRPAGADANDQKRVVTPAAAIQAGADYLVVGRPIVDVSEPAEAARRIAAEISSAC